jgi:hypothetical protein
MALFRVATPNGYTNFSDYDEAVEFALKYATRYAEPMFIDRLVVADEWLITPEGTVTKRTEN